MSHVSRTKISFTTFAPKETPPSAYKDAPVVVGYMVGKATGVRRGENPDGSSYVALTGGFRCFVGDVTPAKSAADPDANSVASGILYMPDAWSAPMITELEKNPGSEIRFAYKVSLVKDGNPQGYTWQVVDMVPAKAGNPLDEIIASTAEAPALEDKSGDKKPAGK